MIKQTVARATVLSRTNFQEADRILTLLTPHHGKLRVLAKGVRKSKSKMAGGIELFSVSEIGYIQGKGELGTLTSSRLIKHYENIVHDVQRTMLGYDLIKLVNRTTEDEPEPAYFELLINAFEALDDKTLSLELVRLWFYAQLLRIAGHTPNFNSDADKNKLQESDKYNFDYDDMMFRVHAAGTFGSGHIKLLRLVMADTKPRVLTKIQGVEDILPTNLRLIETVLKAHVRT